MIGWRALQVVAAIAALACIDLALTATPLRGEAWNAGRLLYAGSGMVTALTLFALAAIGIGQRRLADRLAALEQALTRRE
jgi:hypothetical protein